MAAAIARGSARPACPGAGGSCGPPGREVAVRALGMALQDARTAAGQLAARFRAYAQASGEPAAFARAAAVTAAAQALGQAGQLICGSQQTASGPGREQAAPPGPADQAEEIAQLLAGARLLAGAVSTLEDRTAQLARDADHPAPGCLAGVQACLRAAGQRITQACEPAASPPPGHGQSPPGDPRRETDPQ